jgi:hypothetical protein
MPLPSFPTPARTAGSMTILTKNIPITRIPIFLTNMANNILIKIKKGHLKKMRHPVQKIYYSFNSSPSPYPKNR